MRQRRRKSRIGWTGCGFMVGVLLVAPPLTACQPGDANTFCAHLDSPGVLDTSEDDGQFGRSIAFGDFDGDDRVDLAVGAPGQDAGDGRVFIFYGSGLGYGTEGMQQLTDTEGADAGFGFSLAAGDTNSDGFDDLVVGAPFQSRPNSLCDCLTPNCADVGVVHYLRGSADGLGVAARVVFEAPNAPNCHPGMYFGHALAIGKITNNGAPAIVIGIPGSRAESGLARPGRVQVFQGDGISIPQPIATLQVGFAGDEAGGDEQGSAVAIGRFDLLPERQVVFGAPGASAGGTGGSGRFEVATYDGSAFDRLDRFEQSDFGLAGNASDSHFGAALAVGDFNGDAFLDLAIGAPEHDEDGVNQAGRVYVAFGSGLGLSTNPNFRILAEDSFTGQTFGAQERFGAALAGGDLDGDGFDDLVIGAPGEGGNDTGFVYLVWGEAGGLNPDPARGVNFSQAFLGGSNSTNDGFGSVLAAYDIDGVADGTGTAEIAIGVPAKDVSGNADAGMFYLTRELDPAWIFGDGFESQGLTIWSAIVP